MPRPPRPTSAKPAASNKSAALNVGSDKADLEFAKVLLREKYRQYTETDKASALVALEANGGNLLRTAKALGIPRQTLSEWASDKGISADVPKIRDEKRIDFTEMLEAEINAALGAMHGKRDDGSYSDMARTVGIFIDKLELLRGNATSRHELTGSVSLTDFLSGGGE